MFLDSLLLAQFTQLHCSSRRGVFDCAAPLIGFIWQEVNHMLHDAYKKQLANHQAVWNKPCLATRDVIIANCK